MKRKITFNKYRIVEPFTIILCSRTKEFQGQLSTVDPKSIVYKTKLNQADELKFTYYKKLDNREDPFWNKVENLKIIYVKELDEYFEISFDINENNSLYKEITATSLCEAELSQTMLYGIEINTEDDIARDDYVITQFYSPNNPQGSLLHRILEKTPHYSIKHVDSSLASLQRSFSVDNKSVYDFLTGDCANEFNCLFQFDSTDRTISVYDLYSVCKNDSCSYYVSKNRRYRGKFNDFCPICGSRNISYYGNDTSIFVDKDNLTDEIQFKTDTDNIKNTFKLEAGDDEMTAAVINNNPNGSAYIQYFCEETKRDMSPELVEKINSYDALYKSYQPEYTTLSHNIYEKIDNLLYLYSTMMPTHENEDTDATKEAAKLTAANLSPVGLQNVNSSTSIATVNSALKNYAKVFIHSGKYKVEVNEAQYRYNGIDGSGNNYGTWIGNFILTNYADDEDTAVSSTITVKVYDKYEDFLNQRIQKQIAKDNIKVDDNSVFDVLGIKNISSFRAALKLYCLNRLISFYDAIQSCLDILVQLGHGTPNDGIHQNEWYPLYQDYYTKLQAVQTEIDLRQASIDSVRSEYDQLIKRRSEIQDALDFQKYLGVTLYKEFCSFRREDTYKNDNYISDGLDNTEIFNNANDFLEAANEEMITAGTPQHSISTNLYDLMLMEEFQPIIDNFELGNFIRVKCDNSIYRLRLIEYSINFGSLERLETQFSDITKTANGLNDVRSILDSARTMATSYSSTMRQAEKGQESSKRIETWREVGLNSALYRIVNNDQEDITIDNHGLLSREYLDGSENEDGSYDAYSDKQLKITHNVIAFTDNNWQSVRMAVGELDYELDGNRYTSYGVNADTVVSGIIIGGDIYSGNYKSNPATGTHINLMDGTFSFAGGGLTYDGQKLKLKNGMLEGNTIKSKHSSELIPYEMIIDEGNLSSYYNNKGIKLTYMGLEILDSNRETLGGVYNSYIPIQEGVDINVVNFTGLSISLTSRNLYVDKLDDTQSGVHWYYKGYNGQITTSDGTTHQVVNGLIVDPI